MYANLPKEKIAFMHFLKFEVLNQQFLYPKMFQQQK